MDENDYLCEVIYKETSYMHKNMAKADLNRLKLIIVEEKKTGKWLAEQLEKDQTTISKWCTNSSQPDVASLIKIAKLLGVEVNDLLITD